MPRTKKWAADAIKGSNERIWRTDRLVPLCIVLKDLVGNIVVVDLNQELPFGIDPRMERPPMVCIAAKTEEHIAAMEGHLHLFQRMARADSRCAALASRVQAEVDRYFDIRRAGKSGQEGQQVH